MPNYTYPGAYVTESSLTSLAQTSSGPTAAAFFGEAPRGPSAATLVNDWPTFKNLFGDLDNNYDMCYSVYHYFANGGRSAYVSRLVGAGASTATTSASVAFYPTGSGNASASLFTANAAYPGTWGNALGLEVTAGNLTTSSAGAVKPSFKLKVTLNGTEVENWLELGIDENNNRYFFEVINRYSKYITISSTGLHALTSSAASANASTSFVGSGSISFAGGSSGAAIVLTDLTSALTTLDTIQGNLLLNAAGSYAASGTVIQALLNKAADRGDSFVIIDPLATHTSKSNIATTNNAYAAFTSKNYGAVYAPMLEMVDPLKTGTAAARTTYPGGAVAGVMVRTELARSVAKAPAGYDATIVGALGTTFKLTDSEAGELYNNTGQTNTFKAIPGAGVIINGTRTLERVNPDRFIPVRRTLNYVKRSVKEIVAPATFEPNNQFLWIRLTNDVGNFLNNLWRNGALKGNKSSDAYFVICNSTNNNAANIDQGVVNVSLGVALNYPAEFIVINVSQWTGGSNAVEINI